MISGHCETLVSPDASKRNPRIAATVSPEVLQAINALAERKKWSTSKTAEYLLERGIEAERNQGVSSQPQASDLDKLQQLLNAVKKLDI